MNEERQRLIREINRYRDKPIRQVLVSVEDAPIRYLQGMERDLRQRYNKEHPAVPEQITFNVYIERDKKIEETKMSKEEFSACVEKALSMLR